ncbi:hypothetical protein U9M48_012535 [Paspalum notatum var. saurae]|uniref:Reverse transcriptase zinc-binding domain-containing protein n=1 Tax=Paspalum notatum var. saurae TaxID=547442 RepID=A0AAQ3SXQ9_PASNO
MKMIRCMFEELSGLKINFHKSEISCFGQAKECESLYSNLFGCKVVVQVERKLGDFHFLSSLLNVKDLFLSLGRFKLVSRNQLRSSPLNISFRRTLVGNKLHKWHNLVANLMFVNLDEGNDTFMWGLNKSSSFSVKSIYNSLMNNGIVVSQEIWHLRIPLKIKIFLWSLKRGVLLTKDNLTKPN